MPQIAGDLSFTPLAAAQVLGVNSHTVRRWCADHAQYLSPGASPAKGTARRLTPGDIEVLREVQRLRGEGLQTLAINERLAGLVFGDQTAIEPAQAAQGGPGGAIVPAVVVEHLARIEERLQRVEAQRQRLDVAYLVVMAFIAGLLVGLAVWWFQ